jgi:hypothetical protein
MRRRWTGCISAHIVPVTVLSGFEGLRNIGFDFPSKYEMRDAEPDRVAEYGLLC